LNPINYIFAFFIGVFSYSVNAENDWKKEQTLGNIDFVKIGYGDIFSKNYRSLKFVTECLETDQIVEIIPLITEYNAFEGAKIAEAVKRFRGLVECYEFGRAKSPILHIRIPYWTHQREYYEGPDRGVRISDEEVEKLINEFKKEFITKLHADEYGVDSIMERDVYFWWD